MNESLCKYCEFGDKLCKHSEIYKCDYEQDIKIVDNVISCDKFMNFNEILDSEIL